MKPNRPLVLAAYLVALLLIALPLVDTLATVRPIRLGDVAWRFGATGLLTRAVLTPAVGILLAVGLAYGSGHRRALRAAAIACGLTALLLLALSGLFALDLLQMRARVRHDLKPGFDLAAGQALAKLLLMGGITGLFAWGGWRSASPASIPRERASRAEPARGNPTVLVAPRASPKA